MTTANDEQIAYWNEQAGEKWVVLQDRIDAQLEPLGLVAMDALAPAAGERVLDVGCGCGATSRTLAARVGSAGSVTGVDVSGPMLAQARARAADTPTVRFIQGDAATHPFPPGSFDALFSRFGVMFFADPPAAFANLRRATAPGGRLGFVCWQSLFANEWVRIPIEVAAPHVPLPPPPAPGTPGPFQLADRDRVLAILADAGWADVGVDPHETVLGVGGSADLDETVDFLLRIGPLARVLGEVTDRADAAAAVADALRARLAPLHGPGGVRLGGATWIVTATNPG